MCLQSDCCGLATCIHSQKHAAACTPTPVSDMRRSMDSTDLSDGASCLCACVSMCLQSDCCGLATCIHSQKHAAACTPTPVSDMRRSMDSTDLSDGASCL